MARLKVTGIEEYASKIRALGNTSAIIKPAVYEGAKVLHSAVLSEINALPTDEVWRNTNSFYPAPQGIKQLQKAGLINGLGISPMENKSGFINVRIGFSGYNSLETEYFPGGEPNALVAREVVLGTSRIKRNDFVKKAVRNSKAPAKGAMVKKAEQQIDLLMRKSNAVSALNKMKG